jgi:hypothetical protein
MSKEGTRSTSIQHFYSNGAVVESSKEGKEKKNSSLDSYQQGRKNDFFTKLSAFTAHHSKPNHLNYLNHRFLVEFSLSEEQKLARLLTHTTHYEFTSRGEAPYLCGAKSLGVKRMISIKRIRLKKLHLPRKLVLTSLPF